MFHDQRKHDLNKVKWKTIETNRRNNQSTFHVVAVPHLSFSSPLNSSKINENDIENSNLHLSSTNALSLNIWRELNKKWWVESIQSMRNHLEINKIAILLVLDPLVPMNSWIKFPNVSTTLAPNLVMIHRPWMKTMSGKSRNVA